MKNAEYVAGLATSLEKNLIKSDTFEKLTQVNKTELLKAVLDAGFGKGLAVSNFEELIKEEEKKLVEFVKEYSPSTDFVKYYLLLNDYHNANVLVRNKHVKVDVNRALKQDGNFSKEQISLQIENGNSSLSSYLKDAINEAELLFLKNKASGLSLDSVFKKAYYKESLYLLKNDKVLTDVLKKEIDLVNVSVALRCDAEERLKAEFISGGYLDYEDVKTLLDLNGKMSYRVTELYKDVIKNSVESARNKSALTYLENYKNSLALNAYIDKKYLLQGYEKFYIYVLYKTNEINNVRVLSVGVSAGLNKTEILSRMRLNYAG